MNITDPKIIKLRESVRAAQQEFDMAVMFHESWKPAAYDVSVHQRISHSYAGHTFNIIRVALRRELVLALMRLWDTRKDSLRLENIARTLGDPDVIDALSKDRAPSPESEALMKQDLARHASKAIALIKKYEKGGSGFSTLEALRRMRHKRLAHRDVTNGAVTGPDATDNQIDAFYRDNSEIVKLLLGAVNAVAYDPSEAADVFGHYAKHFWAGVSSERSANHPNAE